MSIATANCCYWKCGFYQLVLEQKSRDCVSALSSVTCHLPLQQSTAELVFLYRLWLNCYELPELILLIFDYISTLRSNTDIFHTPLQYHFYIFSYLLFRALQPEASNFIDSVTLIFFWKMGTSVSISCFGEVHILPCSVCLMCSHRIHKA